MATKSCCGAGKTAKKAKTTTKKKAVKKSG
jgi:hypothetical protein